MQVLVEGVARVVAAGGIFLQRAEACVQERHAIVGISFDVRLHAFDERQRVVDDDVHGCGAVALVVERASAYVGKRLAHPFYKLLLPVGHVNQQIQIRIAFAEQLVAHTASHQIYPAEEWRRGVDLLLYEMKRFLELVHLYVFGCKGSDSVLFFQQKSAKNDLLLPILTA